MPSMKQIIRFTTDDGALEKILRLLQMLCQILAEFAVKVEEVKVWLLLRKQFALGRRYFRFFKFLDCFSKAYDAFYNTSGFGGILLVGKWTCMGGYMMLESSTILDAMGVFPAPWTQPCMVEANRFWFYSLLFSIVWGLLQLLSSVEEIRPAVGVSEKESSGTDAPPSHKKTKPRTGLGVLVRRLLTDGFDIFIPGSITGWIRTSPTTVGLAGLVSTSLGMKDILDRLEEK